MSENSTAIEALEKAEIPELGNFPPIKAEYFSATGKQSDLVGRNLTENTSIKNGKICIKFEEPMWVYDITLWLAENNQAKSDKLLRHTSIELTYARGGKKTMAMSAGTSFIDCYPNDFLVEVEISFFDVRKALLISPPECKRIAITGLNGQEFYDFCNDASKFVSESSKFHEGRSKIIEELKETNKKITSIKSEIEELGEAKFEAEDMLQEEEEKLKKARFELSKAEAKASLLSTKSTEAEQKIIENEQKQKNIIKDIQDNKSKLDKLLADKNVFMEEFSSYVEQGTSNIRTYAWVGVVLFLILGACLWRLIESALTLSNDPTILSSVSAFDLFISRLPIAFVLGAVMIICLRLISTLLGKTFEIHQERLLLSKLSILAKDNSFSSTDGLDISKEVIYEKRVELKMELLKEFLSGNYREAFEKQKKIKDKFESFKENLGRKNKLEPTPTEEQKT